MTGGIVLAGGASSRMGQPKALLRLGGLTMAERLMELFGAFCDQTILITGEHHAEIAAALPHLGASIVYNERHSEGMFSSLRKGLDWFSSAEAVLFSPVDFAAVSASSVASLFSPPPLEVVKPRWRDRSGHPVLIRSDAMEALRNALPTENAKAVLSRFPAAYIDVDDWAVAEDCDTPEDYSRLVQLWESRS